MTGLIRAGLGLALVAAIGCGGTTNVSGKVSYQGKPVVYGSVVVVGADGVPKGGPIQPDGSFQASGVKIGPAKIAVSSPQPPGFGGAKKARTSSRDDPDDRAPADAGISASPEVLKAWVPLPPKYADPQKSELTATIQAGQPLNLDLK